MYYRNTYTRMPGYLSWSHDGNRVIGIDDGGTIRRWDFPSAELHVTKGPEPYGHAGILQSSTRYPLKPGLWMTRPFRSETVTR